MVRDNRLQLFGASGATEISRANESPGGTPDEQTPERPLQPRKLRRGPSRSEPVFLAHPSVTLRDEAGPRYVPVSDVGDLLREVVCVLERARDGVGDGGADLDTPIVLFVDDA